MRSLNFSGCLVCHYRLDFDQSSGEPKLYSLPVKAIIKCIVAFESEQYQQPLVPRVRNGAQQKLHTVANDNSTKGGMGKTVPQLDNRVTDLTRDWEWKKQESFALVSELAVDCKCAK